MVAGSLNIELRVADIPDVTQTIVYIGSDTHTHARTHTEIIYNTDLSLFRSETVSVHVCPVPN